jgi:hypothetical protein
MIIVYSLIFGWIFVIVAILYIISRFGHSDSLVQEISKDWSDDEIDSVPTESIPLYNAAMLIDIIKKQKKQQEIGE